MSSKKKVYILRGIPGQGKSTFAKELSTLYASQGLKASWCSADHYMVDKEGKYLFDRDRLPECHNKCRDDFQDALRAGNDCVIVDNTNTTHREMAPYKALAEAYGYLVTVLTVGSLNIDISIQRGIHEVPLDALERMKKRWEP